MTSVLRAAENTRTSAEVAEKIVEIGPFVQTTEEIA